ncbi:YfgM family protein [Coralloluteibacterium thermophilus]|uniref:YfgM family protein n=1 Tax=Coralloluteibacterium thermophilum TaxID=2707049 RepID=A0ABV9NGM1_9GAMM
MRDNAVALVGGVAVGLALIFGWQGWKGHQSSRSADAAAQYDALRQAARSEDPSALADMARSLQGEHAGSPYAVLAAMRVAEAQLEQGDAAAALATLENAPPTRGDSVLNDLLNLRIARLRLATEDAQGALDALGRLRAQRFAGLAAELRGDAERALDRPDAAREAYAEALTHLDAAAPVRSLVELKLTDLGGQPVAAPEA